jgi:hypothetical protein
MPRLILMQQVSNEMIQTANQNGIHGKSKGSLKLVTACGYLVDNC